MIAPEKIDELLKFGFRRESILGTDKKPGWTVERVERTLHTERWLQQRALERAAKKAGREDGVLAKPRRQPSHLEREGVAAVELERASNPDEMIEAIRGVVIYLSDDEAARLRAHLIRLFRGTP